MDTGFDPEGRFAWIRYGAPEPSTDEVIATLLALCRDPRLEPEGGILMDRGTAPPDTARVRLLVEKFSVHATLFRRRRLAFVVRDHATYGMIRMGQLLGADLRVDSRIFATQEEAEAWLKQRFERGDSVS